MEKLILALAQINPTVGFLDGNQKKILSFTRTAQAAGADLVVFPELALVGYPPEDLLLKKHFVRENLSHLKELAAGTADIIMVVGFVDQDKNGHLYNAAAVIQNGKIKIIYHKSNLPNYGVFDEKRYFKPGQNSGLFAIGSLLVGLNICEDIWEEQGIFKKQAAAGAGLIINISASPFYSGRQKERRKMLVSRARSAGVFLAYCNQVGGQDELVFDGGSLVLDASGKIQSAAGQFDEKIIYFDLALKNKKSKKIFGSKIIKLAPPGNASRTGPPSVAGEELEPTAEIFRSLVTGVRDYVRKNKFKTVIIGLSGGIDSALTAALAVEALGEKNVVGVTMPSIYSSLATRTDARRLAENLNIMFLTVPISEILGTYLKVLSPELKSISAGLTEENLQARIRGNILMAFSNKFGWLVLTTGNKSETAVGYCTLYGDTAGGFAVLKDVPKSLVYRLARFYNQKNGPEIIPESIFNRPPTAELKPDQKDQDSLPPYPVLDRILKMYVEEDKSAGEISRSGKIGPAVVKEIIKKIDGNEYKRRQSPPGIKITPKAFGRDRRLPITNGYRET